MCSTSRIRKLIPLGLVFSALPGIAANFSGPSIQFVAPIFDFGRARAGDLIRHDFIFSNTGNATLEIKAVTPSCGCTTAMDWTRRVEPGRAGQISLQFDTTRFGGPITEVATVANNDRAHYKVTLSFTGTVWRPVDIRPLIVILKPVIDTGAGATNEAEIINHLSEPITLGNPVSDNPAFEGELKTIVPEREFRLIVQSAPTDRSRMMRGNITMRTSSASVPSITVGVLAIPQAPFVLSPAVVSLPAGPLTAATNATVLFRNNGRKPVTVAQARIDVPGAEVEMKEVQPGREFAFTLSFPQGFQLPKDREASLIIRIFNPQTPVVNVPLRPLTLTNSRAAVLPKPAPQNN